ncbi:MAG: hypothetical protein AAGH99_08060 [Planctomycetota bacterium]
MAQRKFHEKVETWIVVTIIAALVWLYAEATVLKQETGKSVRLEITEPTAGFVITPNIADLRISYRGSSGQIQQFNKATESSLVHELDPNGVTEPTVRTIILDEALIRAGLGEIGITDLEIEPAATLNVTIQPLKTIDLPIVVDVGDVELNGNPVVAPDRISITAPFDIVEQLRGESIVATLIDTGESENLERVATNVPLTYPDALEQPWLPADDSQVRINYTLANDLDTLVVNRVPLFINLPVDVQLRYTVRPQDQTNFLTDVQLQGPADVIARIRENEKSDDKDPALTIRAELSITDLSKIEQTSLERPVIITPPGITLVQLPEVMPITVQRRATPGN